MKVFTSTAFKIVGVVVLIIVVICAIVTSVVLYLSCGEEVAIA